MYECLFEENQIGAMKLKNRLIVPAMSTRFVGGGRQGHGAVHCLP